jgi:rhamnulokinase
MAAAIRQFCRRTGQPQPDSMGAMVRCCLESLAFRYRETLGEIRGVYRHPINRIHIIGGGAKNGLLCSFAASACKVPVMAGPVEATAMGNIMVQAMAAGLFSSLEEMREVIRKSSVPVVYRPEEPEAWEEAYGLFKRICHEGQKRSEGV